MGAAWARGQRQERIDSIARTWEALAASRGLQFVDAIAGVYGQIERLPRVDGKVGGVVVSLELEQPEATVLVSATPEARLGGHCHARRETFPDKLGKLLGLEDIRVGDAAFDLAFLVQATSDAVASAVLVPAVRAEMLALDVATLTYDDGTEEGHGKRVSLRLRSDTPSRETFDRALDLVVEVARLQSLAAPYR